MASAAAGGPPAPLAPSALAPLPGVWHAWGLSNGEPIIVAAAAAAAGAPRARHPLPAVPPPPTPH